MCRRPKKTASKVSKKGPKKYKISPAILCAGFPTSTEVASLLEAAESVRKLHMPTLHVHFIIGNHKFIIGCCLSKFHAGVDVDAFGGKALLQNVNKHVFATPGEPHKQQESARQDKSALSMLCAILTTSTEVAFPLHWQPLKKSSCITMNVLWPARCHNLSTDRTNKNLKGDVPSTARKQCSQYPS